MMQGAGRHVLGMRGQKSVLCVDRQARVAADDIVAGRAARTRAGCPSHSAPSASQLSQNALHPELCDVPFFPRLGSTRLFRQKKSPPRVMASGRRFALSPGRAVVCGSPARPQNFASFNLAPLAGLRRSMLQCSSSCLATAPTYTGGDTKGHAYSKRSPAWALKARREREIDAPNSIL